MVTAYTFSQYNGSFFVGTCMFSHSITLRGFLIDGMFDTYINQLDYMPKWTPIEPKRNGTILLLNFSLLGDIVLAVHFDQDLCCLFLSGLADDCRPGMRGGHQMAIDTPGSKIFRLYFFYNASAMCDPGVVGISVINASTI